MLKSMQGKQPLLLKNIHSNNLNIECLEIPLDQFVVFCGPSGSGKSSLAFDVVYAAAEKLGRAFGVSRVYRAPQCNNIVDNLPQQIIAIEQQLNHRTIIESVAYHTKLVSLVQNMFAPHGQSCPECKGKGYIRGVDAQRLVCDAEKSVTQGAFTSAVKKSVGLDILRWRTYCQTKGLNQLASWKSLPFPVQQELLYTGVGEIKPIIPSLNALNEGKGNKDILEELDYYITNMPCPQCHGWGFTESGSATCCLQDVKNLLEERYRWLKMLDIGHIHVHEPMFNLSSSVARKIRFFAALLQSKPQSLIIFDEPAAGLMPNEARQMAEILRSLQGEGHGIIAIEHSRAFVESADTVIAFGPGAGKQGGKIVFKGTPQEYFQNAKTSAVGKIARGTEKIAKDFVRAHFRRWYGFKDFKVEVPQMCFVCVCGPSGSGKSAYIEAAYAACDKSPVAWQGRTDLLARKGQDLVRRPHKITAEPIGIHSGSTVATYTALWDAVRDIFALLPEAKKRHLQKGHFSFNTSLGRCPRCQGKGYDCHQGIALELCPECHGTRFNPEVLDIKHHGYSIADINACTVEEALKHFDAQSAPQRHLAYFVNLALEYLVLGQLSNTLSGGENIRIKLVTLLAKRLGERSLYIMDNPCRGIGEKATDLLLTQLHLLTKNYSVLVAENTRTVASSADWIILLGNPSNKTHGEQSLTVRYQGRPTSCPKDIWESIWA